MRKSRREETGASGRAGGGESRPGRAAVGTNRAGDTALASKHEAVVLATTPKRAQGGPN